jgi:sugar phosphate isomerase/epimerase
LDQIIALNIYTLRDLCEDATHLETVLKELRTIGYRYIQTSGIGRIAPEKILDAMENAGMRCCGTHLGWEEFVRDIDEVIALHKLFGANHTAIGSLPPEYHSQEGAERYLAEARDVIPALTDAGMDYSHHNHDHEFVRLDGTTWIDYVYQAGASFGMKFEIDTYWVVAGGADPATYIERFSDAMSIVHVKDMVVAGRRDQRFAPVGHGNLNWPRIFAAIRNAPIEYVIVEQDAHYDDDPMENVALSYDFLREHGFAQ